MRFRKRQILDEEQPSKERQIVDAFSEKTRWYGDGVTIHSSGELDVETFEGNVVAVWFRCSPLRFKQTQIDKWRAAEMKVMYEDEPPALRGVSLVDKKHG